MVSLPWYCWPLLESDWGRCVAQGYGYFCGSVNVVNLPLT